MQRFYVEFDHRKFGFYKMRDAVIALLPDIALLTSNSQNAAVLVPIDNKDYSNMAGTPRGVRLGVQPCNVANTPCLTRMALHSMHRASM